MTVPAIKNYENRPPAGGWNLSYRLNGQKFRFSGGWSKITSEVADLLRRNDAFVSMDEIFAYCNGIWCARDPGRCMNPAQRSVAQKQVGGCRSCGAGRHRNIR